MVLVAKDLEGVVDNNKSATLGGGEGVGVVGLVVGVCGLIIHKRC